MRKPAVSMSPKYAKRCGARSVAARLDRRVPTWLPAPHTRRPSHPQRCAAPVRVRNVVQFSTTSHRPVPRISWCTGGQHGSQRSISYESRPGPNSGVNTTASSAFSSPQMSSDRSRWGTTVSARRRSHALTWPRNRRSGSLSRPAASSSAAQPSSACHTIGVRGGEGGPGDITLRTYAGRRGSAEVSQRVRGIVTSPPATSSSMPAATRARQPTATAPVRSTAAAAARSTGSGTRRPGAWATAWAMAVANAFTSRPVLR